VGLKLLKKAVKVDAVPELPDLFCTERPLEQDEVDLYQSHPASPATTHGAERKAVDDASASGAGQAPSLLPKKRRTSGQTSSSDSGQQSGKAEHVVVVPKATGVPKLLKVKGILILKQLIVSAA